MCDDEITSIVCVCTALVVRILFLHSEQLTSAKNDFFLSISMKTAAENSKKSLLLRWNSYGHLEELFKTRYRLGDVKKKKNVYQILLEKQNHSSRDVLCQRFPNCVPRLFFNGSVRFARKQRKTLRIIRYLRLPTCYT